MKVDGMNVVVTGGSQGLGREIAEHFLRAGANVAICARDENLLERTQEELEGLAGEGRRLVSAACDVSREGEVAAFFDFVRGELGQVDAVVLNAGIYGPMGPTESVDLAEWRQAMDVNLFGVLLPCRAVIPDFKARGEGKIIIVSGGGATNPMPNVSAYAASKAAVVRLMETLAGELEPHGIQVNAIAPGALKTRMMDEVIAAGAEKVGEKFYEQNKKWIEGGGSTPLNLGAELCVFLASEESGDVTGRLISAKWDPWKRFGELAGEMKGTDIFCLRRIVPEDRGLEWGTDEG